MHVLLYIGFAIFGLIAVAFFGGAQGAIQEGVAAIVMLCSILCLVGAGIIGWLTRIHEALQAQPPVPPFVPSPKTSSDAKPSNIGPVMVVFAIIAVIVIGAVVIRKMGYGFWFEK